MARTQFMLIEREGYHPTAVSQATYRAMIARGDEGITASRPITKAEIKRGRIHVYEDADYVSHKVWEDRKTAWHDKEFDAQVIWFNRASGNGYVQVEDGPKLAIHACNIEGKKTWFPETACVYYTAGQRIRVKLEVFAGGAVFCIGLTPGTFDDDKYSHLNPDKLAFRCDGSGKLVSGLFT